MERGSITKYLLLGLAIFLFMQFGTKALFGTKGNELQPLGGIFDETTPAQLAPEQICTIDGPRFKAELSTHGASLRHVYLKGDQYTAPATLPSSTPAKILHLVTGDAKGSSEPADLVSTSRAGRSPLRVDLRVPGDAKDQQVPYDDLDWKLAKSDDKSCTFTYADASTSLTKVISLGAEPFVLDVAVTVKNLAAEPREHRFTIEQTAYRRAKEMEGNLGRQSELLTKAVAVTTTKKEFEQPNDFEPKDFSKPEFTAEKWRRSPGTGRLAAVSNVYFTEAVMPESAPAGDPAAETLIEEIWQRGCQGKVALDRKTCEAEGGHWGDLYPRKEQDPEHAYVFRSRLVYPEKELKPGESVTYKMISFTGPKERDLLTRVDRGLPEVLELGTFATIARYLVKYLYILHGVVRSWGWAIVLLTISVRMVLFPLSLSQIKNSMAMRKLKPEMDALNEKYKDDAAQKGIAIQELWRKNGVSNPVVGCAPMLLQMPIWWALYTALQTAVELYHVPFGPVIPDLSAPGRYLIIPIVLGGSSLLQQKLMPAQGDPSQQKMMMYMMPAVFTVMMLFLPAGLGVYMVTNSVLAIAQQLLVERYLKGNAPPAAGKIEVRVK